MHATHHLTRVILMAVLCFIRISGLAQGSLTYQNAQFGQPEYVFLPDPNNPTVPKIGGRGGDYAGFSKVAGPGYYAELWWAPGEDLVGATLASVPGSRATFRSGSTAGLFNGRSKLEIAGTYGGDKVVLQLRVWENLGGLLQTWEAALNTSGIARGESNRFLHELSGIDRNGKPRLGTGSTATGLPNFSLALSVPEPGCLGFLLIGLAWIKQFSRKSH